MKKTQNIVLVGLYSAVLLVLQLALMTLPNIELVSFLFIIYGLTLPFKMSLMISFVFVILQALVHGFGDWVIAYIWIWPLWVTFIYLLKPIIKERTYGWAIISGLWGILFGMLFAINHGIFYGFNFSMIYWIKGLSFDLIHLVSNYLITLLLFEPTLKHFKIYRKGE